MALASGGAIAESGLFTSLTNTEVRDNASGGDGGGLFVAGPTLTLRSSTIARNTAGGNGGGIECGQRQGQRRSRQQRAPAGCLNWFREHFAPEGVRSLASPP